MQFGRMGRSNIYMEFRELIKIIKRFRKDNPTLIDEYEKCLEDIERYKKSKQESHISPQEQFFGMYNTPNP